VRGGAPFFPARGDPCLIDRVLRHPVLAALLVLTLVPVSAAGARRREPVGLGLATLSAAGLPLFCGAPTAPFVALTFDDGPSAYTDSVLRELRRARAAATFFLVGSRVGERPDTVRAEARLGELGNHTWSHVRLATLKPAAALRQLRMTQRAIRKAVGWRPLLYRPPYGVTTPATSKVGRDLHLLDVRWSVDSGDSRPWATASAAVRTAVAGLVPGAIVLMHDVHPWSAFEVRVVLREARRRGLFPVTISELLALDPPTWRQMSPGGDGSRCR
jgi:peptidoglycan/xylan/chitin deacetylase (PgdA/CDA1 family)